MTRAAAVLLALCLALVAPAAALACARTSLGDVENEVMCLECGVPLDVATGSLQAQQERTFITRQIAACRTKDQIKAALAAQYGDRVLAAPKASGFGLAAYVVPAAALVAAVAAVAFAALRWRGRKPRPSAGAGAAAGGAAGSGDPPPAAATPPDSPPPSTDPREAARLEADLGRYDL